MKKQLFFRTIAVMLVVVMTFGRFAFLPEKVKAESYVETMTFGLFVGGEDPIATTSVENDGVYTISYSGEAFTVGPWGVMYIKQTEGCVADSVAIINSIKINEIDYDVPSAWQQPSFNSVAEINDEYIIEMAFYNRWGQTECNIGDGTGDDLNDLEITDIEVTFQLCEINEYEYEITDDNTIELIQYIGTKKNIVIPEEIDGLTVSRIAGSLFEGNNGVETITIPDSVTSIDAAAFRNCFQLQSISVSEDNTAYSSEDGVLYSKEKDKLVKYPATKADICFLDSVTQIGEYAFAGCKLIHYPVIPDGITAIGVAAFYHGTELKAIMIPASVNDMEDGAIYYCDDITIYGYASTQAEEYADANSIPFVDMTDKVLISDCDIELDRTEFYEDEAFDPQVTVKYAGAVLTEGEDYEVETSSPYVIVKGINDYTWFMRIETTTKSPLEGYRLLEDGTAELEYWYSGSLGEILYLPSVMGGYDVTGISWDGEELYSEYVVIPEGVTYIADNAFSLCSNLKAIKMPESVVTIGSGVFEQCDDITIYGYATTTAETYADANGIPFVDMTDKILITDCDVELDKTEFDWEEEFNPQVTVKYFDEVLTEGEDFEVELNQPYVTVKGINEYTWIKRIETTTLNNPWTYKVLSDGTVEIAPNGPFAEAAETLVIPDTIDGYKVTGVGAFYENLYSDYVVVPEGVTYIADDAFSLCCNLRGISLPNTLKSIGDRAFNYCESLTTIELPDGLEQIGENIFSQCSNLTTVIISAGTSDVRSDIFTECSSLESIQVDENNENYASINGVLYNKDFTELIFCPIKVQDIEIPETVIEIGEYAFYSGEYNRKISDIELPDRVQKIGEHSFGFCYSLSTITVPETVTYIGEQAFTECNKLIMLGYAGSYAESYATEHGISFIDIGTYTPLFKCQVSIDEDLYYYDGENKKPLVTVKDNDIVLEEDVDYSVEYTGNTDVGCGTVTITGLGEYVGTVNKYFCIIPQDAESGGVCKYIDGKITPSYTYVVKRVTNTITAGIIAAEDCGVDYSFNDWVKHIIKVTDTSGNVSYYSFGGSYATWDDDMDGDDVPDVGGADSDQWLGTVVDHKAQLSIPVGGKGTTVEFYCTAWAGYDGAQFVVYITGDRKTITDNMITIDKTEYDYDGTAKTPGITVKYGDNELVNNVDYTISYNNNKDAGTATVTITGQGNYRGTVKKNFIINKARQTLVANISKSEIMVGDTATISAEGIGTITYSSDNTKVATVDSNGILKGISDGTAVITVTAAGNNNYESDKATITVTVKAPEPVEINLSDCTVTLGATTYAYDGTAKKPTVTVKDGTTKLVYGTDYTVAYSNNIHTGTATVTVTGKGEYVGIVNKTFTITATGKCGDNATWAFNSKTGAFTVTGTGNMYEYLFSSRTPWFKFKTQIKTVSIGSGITSVGTNAFYGCTSLTKVTGCANVTTIGINTFRNCTALTSVAGCSKVTMVNQYAFCGSTSFATLGATAGTVSLPAATKIGGYAFYQCGGIKILNTYSPLTYMGTSAFRNCSALTTVTIGAGCNTIGSYAFCGDKALTSVKGCAGVTGIGAYAFWGDTALTSVAGMSKVTSVGNYGFYNCAKLTTVGSSTGKAQLNAVKGIGSYAFSGCKAMTSFTAGANLTQIGTYAFSGDSALKTIYLKTTKLTTVGAKAFNGIKSTAVIYVPSAKLTTYKNGVLKGKGQAATVTIKSY